MFEPVSKQKEYLKTKKLKFPQYGSRYGRKPNVIVLHSTGSGRSPDSVAKALVKSPKAGSWHTILDEHESINLIALDKASYSNNLLYNLRTINIGLCLPDTEWPRLIKNNLDTLWLYHLAYVCSSAAKFSEKKYGKQIKPEKIDKKEFNDGKSGFISHGELNNCSCFKNKFPWDNFLQIFNQINDPKQKSLETVVAESAAVSCSPGAISSALLKDYGIYEQLGKILVNSLPEKIILKTVFYRFAERNPTDEELGTLEFYTINYGLEDTLQMMADQINLKNGSPTRNDLKLFQIQSSHC